MRHALRDIRAQLGALPSPRADISPVRDIQARAAELRGRAIAMAEVHALLGDFETPLRRAQARLLETDEVDPQEVLQQLLEETSDAIQQVSWRMVVHKDELMGEVALLLSEMANLANAGPPPALE